MYNYVEVQDNKILVYPKREYELACKNIPSYKINREKRCYEYPLEAALDIGKELEHFKWDDSFIDLFLKEKEKYNKVIELKNNMDKLSDPYLMKHQVLVREIARIYDKYAFFLDTGTGKTIAALSIIKDNPHIKWLIIAPKSIIKTAWLNDLENYYPEFKLLPVLSKKDMTKAKLREFSKKWNIKIEELFEKADGYITNPENFKNNVELFKNCEGLIFDESSLLKDPKSEITRKTLAFGKGYVEKTIKGDGKKTKKELVKISNGLKKIYILSGTPAPNNYMEFWAQMTLIDESLFGSSFYAFRNRYFYSYGYKNYQWDYKRGAKQAIMERVERKALFITKEECLDLPEKTYIIREVTMPAKAMEYYRRMEEEKFVELGDGTSIKAPNVLSSLMKLRQITSGFIIDNENELNMIHKAKLEELMNVLEEIENKQVIIWIQFKNEVETIKMALEAKGKTVVTAYSETKDVNESIEKFKSGEAQYIIAHPKTLKFGVTFTNCTYAVYYSLSYSLEEYQQSHDRIYRKGQTKPCTFIFLLVPDTIDYVCYSVVHEKKDITREIIRYSKQIGKERAKSGKKHIIIKEPVKGNSLLEEYYNEIMSTNIDRRYF
ncbi:DEAD/DEAH box helicase [Caldanaerobacter subterraneus]|uniref:DEAD/DEAH box helicase n=1 Tax=Caldanaerobacter subterraneus TaxID=911092 RepID=A0A7Y2L607_9THEO|nr:DEAD/DEAH box helicase [Caldanaerobacter subterraneus]NNG66448.1 DEAD/DEAH box helicase [Caldanaerobacter subterraneus]